MFNSLFYDTRHASDIIVFCDSVTTILVSLFCNARRVKQNTRVALKVSCIIPLLLSCPLIAWAEEQDALLPPKWQIRGITAAFEDQNPATQALVVEKLIDLKALE